MLRQKYSLLILPALLATFSTFGIDIQLPALPTMAQYFHVNVGHLEFSLSLFVLGLGIGQFMLGPVSDHYGRKPVLLSCLMFFLLTCIALIFVKNITAFMSLRLLQAVCAAGANVIVFAYLRDILSPTANIKANAMMSFSISLSPTIAPIIGGYLLHFFNWQAHFVFLGIYSIMLLIGVWFFLPESLVHKNKQRFHPITMLQTYLSLFSDSDYCFFVLSSGMSLAAIIVFVVAAPHLLIELAGINPEYFGYYFAINSVVLTAGFLVSSRVIHYFTIKQTLTIGASFMLAGSLLMIIFGILAKITVFFIIFPMIIVSVGITLVLPLASACAVIPYPHQAGSAAAMNGFSRSIVASVTSAIVSYFPSHSQLPLGFMLLMLGAITVLSIKGIHWSRFSQHI